MSLNDVGSKADFEVCSGSIVGIGLCLGEISRNSGLRRAVAYLADEKRRMRGHERPL